MNPGNSLVHAYFKAFPESRTVVHGTLQGTFTSGDDLVDKNLKPMIDWVYGKIADMVAPKELTAAQALMYIEELSVFARYNAQFLKQAAASVEGFCSSSPRNCAATTSKRVGTAARSRLTTCSTPTRC